MKTGRCTASEDIGMLSAIDADVDNGCAKRNGGGKNGFDCGCDFDIGSYRRSKMST